MGANELNAKTEIVELEYKGKLIDKIIFKCKVSNVAHNKHIPLDNVFMALIGCTISELNHILSEL